MISPPCSSTIVLVITRPRPVPSASGRPVANALVDWWQCDARGAYDNRGYRFRGHQFADARGRYTLFTVVPGIYPGRTRHIHVKVQAPRKRVLTTQLFFPGVAANRSDAAQAAAAATSSRTSRTSDVNSPAVYGFWMKRVSESADGSASVV